MALPANNAQESEVMAKLAARLMGRAQGPSISAPPEASKLVADLTTPRTLPGSPGSIPLNITNSVAPTAVRTTAIRALGGQGGPTPTPTPAPAVTRAAPPSEDTEMTDADTRPMGPSLFGTDEQLAAAREMAKSMTSAGNKARSGRSRLISKQGSRSSLSNAGSISPARSSVASRAAAGGYPSMSTTRGTRPAPSPRAEARTLPVTNVTNYTLHLVNSARPGPAVGWNAFAANRKPQKVESPTIAPGEPTSSGLTIAGTPPPTPMVKKQENMLHSTPQITNPPNTPKERAHDARIPPHLKAKAAAAMAKKSDVPTAAVSNGVNANDSGFDKVEVTTSNGNHDPVNPSVNGEFVQRIPSPVEDKGTVLEAHHITGVTAAGEQASAPTTQNATAPPQVNGAMEASNGMRTEHNIIFQALEAVKEELAAINKRISGLEDENFVLQKQVVAMLQAEERRKYLGTDNAKIPFVLEVKCHNGASHHVQVHADLKIAEFIRRIRAKADLAPTATANPRVIVGGEQAGHGLTLGEMGVIKDKVAEVIFMYDRTT